MTPSQREGSADRRHASTCWAAVRATRVNRLAQAFPASEFIGDDFSAEAVAVARTEAQHWGLNNAHFEVRDVTNLDGTGTFALITAFDAIHDQAHPAKVLEQIQTHLDPDGTYLMVDIHASSDVDSNLDLPWAPFLCAISTMPCMTVSLALGGEGLGGLGHRTGVAAADGRRVPRDPGGAAPGRLQQQLLRGAK